MAQKHLIGIRRMRNGPRRSRVKLGPRIFIAFFVMAIVTAVYAIAVNIDAEDKINAFHERLRHQAEQGHANDKR